MRGAKRRSFEALIRWDHPQEGLISPARFVPVAESSGFIIPLGDWILDAACKQVRDWIEQGYGNSLVSVNLSPQQINQGDPLRSIGLAMEKWKIPASTLEIEITESGLMESEQQTIELLTQIRSRGIRIALDDFGTGYSSLSYLRELPIDTLKIDRSFIASLEEHADSVEVLHCIVDLAKRLNLETVCEGVETHGQLRIVQTLGCDVVQGYIYSKPLPAKQAAAFYDTLWKQGNLRGNES